MLNPQGFKIPTGDNLSPLPPLSSKLLFFPVSCSFVSSVGRRCLTRLRGAALSDACIYAHVMHSLRHAGEWDNHPTPHHYNHHDHGFLGMGMRQPARNVPFTQCIAGLSMPPLSPSKDLKERPRRG